MIPFTQHGLSDSELKIIQKVLCTYGTKLEKIGIFGSRSNGKYKTYSDINLVVYGDISPKETNRLNTLFDESSLGVRVDVKNYTDINYPPLKRHIDAVVKILFFKEQLQ